MPFTAMSPNAGAPYLYAGISGAGDSVAEGITRMSQNLRQAKAYRAMAVDALGMDPDQVDKMGLGELQGHVQAESMKSLIEQRAAQAQERQAKAEQLRMQTDEANAWPLLMQHLAGQGAGAPAAPPSPDVDPGNEMPAGPAAMMGAPAAGGGGGAGPLDQNRLIDAMAAMGKTSPRLAAALARSVMPQLMTGGAMGPQSWMSPGGTRYNYLHNTFLQEPDHDLINGMMGQQAPPGYNLVQTSANRVQPVKTPEKVLPQTFHSALDQVTKDIYGAQTTLNSPDTEFADAATAKARKANAQRILSTAKSTGKALVDRYHTTGYLTDEQRDNMYTDLSLGGGTKDQTAPPAAGGGSGGRVKVTKDGKTFTVPASKAEAAKAQGYKVLPD